MRGFAAWLHEINETTNPVWARLNRFATDHPDQWPYWSNDVVHYLGRIRTTVAEANQADLIAALVIYFARWRTEQTGHGFWRTAGASLASSAGKIALIAFGLFFVWILVRGLSGTGFGGADQVRGMVTFFFVLTITGVIILTAVGIFWLQNDDAVKVRFAAAKDLLTVVIGVLGTIMGFYFGSATGETANLSIASTSLSPPVIHAGESATISSHIKGGTQPYNYSVVFSDPANALTKEQLAALKIADKSADGQISKEIKGPQVKASAILLFTLTATDAKSVSSVSTGAIYVEPAKPAAIAAPATPATQIPAAPAKKPGE